jgi:putative nucleotidyltransferase with HDIG domain
VLKIVNSAYYGQRREVASIDAAVVVLGFAAVKNIAVAAGLARMFRMVPLSTGFAPHLLWTHAIAVATASRTLAARVRGVEPQEAFLAGLLHDIGMIIELQACQSGFLATIVSSATDATRPFREWETEHIGVTHEAMGAALCRAWRFPDSLRNVAGFHHRPMELPAASRRLVAIVHVADHLAARAAIGFTQSVAHEPLQPEVLEWLELPADELDAFRAALPAQVAEVTPMLSGGT